MITTFSGLYRFRTGTVIYITRIEDGQIYFRPITRMYRGISFQDGTMLHYYYLYEPLKQLEARYDLRLTDCAFWGDEHGITVMPELSAHRGNVEKASGLDTELLAAQLKEALEDGKQLALPPVMLRFSRPGSHIALRQLQAEKLHISRDQIYPTHYVSDPEEQRFLLERGL